MGKSVRHVCDQDIKNVSSDLKMTPLVHVRLHQRKAIAIKINMAYRHTQTAGGWGWWWGFSSNYGVEAKMETAVLHLI